MFNSIIKSLQIIFSEKKEFYRSLIEILGFYPGKFEYYELALIHKSASHIEPDGTNVNNERLEYLGDAILDAIVGDFLYHKFPKENEGFLTQMRAKIVNGENLCDLAQKIGINKFIVSQINNSKGLCKIYEDAFEAFIGAIYLDKGYITTKSFILDRIFKNFVDIKELKDIDTNFKSQLIEWSQKYKKEVVFYTDVDESNSKYFSSYICIDNEKYGTGHGSSKKSAEQKAAKETLEMVSNEEQPDEKFDLN